VGASGSGKSTLRNILAGLDVPSAATVKVAGRDIGALGQREWLDYRRRQVGLHLAADLTELKRIIAPA